MQGISPIKPLFAKIRLENICKFSRIQEIPYAKSQGIILREQGNNSAFWTGTGNLAQNRSALPTYLISSKRIYIVDKTIINRHVCEIITEHRLDAGRGRHEGAQGQLTRPGTLALYGDVSSSRTRLSYSHARAVRRGATGARRCGQSPAPLTSLSR